jgi:hypothetical protein
MKKLELKVFLNMMNFKEEHSLWGRNTISRDTPGYAPLFLPSPASPNPFCPGSRNYNLSNKIRGTYS